MEKIDLVKLSLDLREALLHLYSKILLTPKDIVIGKYLSTSTLENPAHRQLHNVFLPVLDTRGPVYFNLFFASSPRYFEEKGEVFVSLPNGTLVYELNTFYDLIQLNNKSSIHEHVFNVFPRTIEKPPVFKSSITICRYVCDERVSVIATYDEKEQKISLINYEYGLVDPEIAYKAVLFIRAFSSYLYPLSRFSVFH